MAKNEFKVTSSFKIIIKICKKTIQFCGKTFKFLPNRCPVHFLYFLFTVFRWRGANTTSMSKKYIENKIFDST